MFGAFINGLGIYVPEKILNNAYFEKIVNTSDEWIVSRTGIKCRHMAAEEEVTSDLALQATLAALQDAGRNVEEITHVIVATCNPDSLCPSTACVLINKLGIKNKKIMAIDVNAACSGFVNGLQLAQYIACSDPNALILVVSSEIMTSKCDWTDRSTCILFGDGAGAILISQQLPPNYHGFTAKIKDILINSDGSYSHLLTVKAGGTTLPYTLGDTVGKEYFVLMEGREVFKHAVRGITRSMSSMVILFFSSISLQICVISLTACLKTSLPSMRTKYSFPTVSPKV